MCVLIAPQATLDPEMAAYLADHLVKKGVALRLGSGVEGFEADFHGDYLSVEFGRPFDAIWCSHVFEHQRHPGRFLEKIFRDLSRVTDKGDGSYAFTVTNSGRTLTPEQADRRRVVQDVVLGDVVEVPLHRPRRGAQGEVSDVERSRADPVVRENMVTESHLGQGVKGAGPEHPAHPPTLDNQCRPLLYGPPPGRASYPCK